MTTPTSSGTGTSTALEAYLSYPFQSDQTFQQGIATIPSNNLTPEMESYLLLRARVFYFNRTTGHSITLEEAKEHEQTSTSTTIPPTIESTSTTTSTNDGSTTAKEEVPKPNEPETQVLSFAELKNLIETGQMDKIPNNKQIPSSLNEESPSVSNAQARKKPWELSLDSSNSSEIQTQTQTQIQQ